MNIIEKNSHLKKRAKEEQYEPSLDELKQKVRELEEQVEKKRLKEKIKDLEDELNGKASSYKPYWLSDDEKEKMKESDRYLYGHSTFDPAKITDTLFRNSFGIPMPRTWQEYEWLTKFYC